ncbi:MAG: MBL fold metallo-hydrolase [Verrucomicrobia bacterium]|nr:MBL fold metallo-hydrolase [Verrucomicrobiota bacterium]
MGYFDDKADLSEMPSSFSFPLKPTSTDLTKPKALWINHSTFFIKMNGVHFLTDPIWGRRCSPLPFLGPIRKHQAPIALEDLGKVDHVLISHNHYDHLDKKTVLSLHKLYPHIKWWVPLGVKKWFTRMGINSVEELGWWESVQIHCPNNLSHTLQFTAVPAQHFSGRSFKDVGKTLWAGWVVESFAPSFTKRLYFVGDTGYNPVDFKSIGNRWSHMDLSLIPIGSYVPRKFMSPVHIDPWQAVKIHQEVNSKQSIGMHWNTFRLSDEERNRPPYDLFLALKEANIDPLTFLAVPPGHEIHW